MVDQVIAIGELRPEVQLVREALADVIVRHAFADRLDCLLHRIDLVVGICPADADVVPLQRRAGRQHEIGPANSSRPPQIDADNGFDLLQRPDQSVRVLLVRHEDIADVVDHLHVRVSAGHAVTDEVFAGSFQHLGDAAGRADTLDPVAPLAEADGRGLARLRHSARPIVPRKPDALPRLADLAAQGGEVDDGPVSHLAMLGALKRPCTGDLGLGCSHRFSQFADLVGRDAGNLFGSFGGLRGVVILALNIVDPFIRADGIFRQILAVFQTFFEHMERHGAE